MLNCELSYLDIDSWMAIRLLETLINLLTNPIESLCRYEELTSFGSVNFLRSSCYLIGSLLLR